MQPTNTNMTFFGVVLPSRYGAPVYFVVTGGTSGFVDGTCDPITAPLIAKTFERFRGVG